jgi:hypothetical protein
MSFGPLDDLVDKILADLLRQGPTPVRSVVAADEVQP